MSIQTANLCAAPCEHFLDCTPKVHNADAYCSVTFAPLSAEAQGFAPDVDYVSRYFAPWMGINEDPATGSSQCTLAPFYSAYIGSTKFTGGEAAAVARLQQRLACSFSSLSKSWRPLLRARHRGQCAHRRQRRHDRPRHTRRSARLITQIQAAPRAADNFLDRPRASSCQRLFLVMQKVHLL